MRRFTLVLLALFLLPAAVTACLGHTRSAPETDASVDGTPADNRQRAAIEQRLIEWNRLYRAALANPSAPHDELDAITTGPLLQGTRNQIENARIKHEHEIPGPESRASFRVAKVSLTMSGADVIACDHNDYWMVRDDDGVPTDTRIYTTKLLFKLRLTDQWRVSNARTISSEEGIKVCGA